MATYTVDLAFEVHSVGNDPQGFGRESAVFGSRLPTGSRIERVGWMPDGLANVIATVPANGIAHALHSVATALELTAAQSPGGFDNLGEMRRAVVERVGE